LRDRFIGDDLRQRQRYVLLGDDALCAGWQFSTFGFGDEVVPRLGDTTWAPCMFFLAS